MSKEKTYNNQEPDTSHIDKFSDKNSFKTPEGYFDSFPDKIAEMAQAASTAPASSSVWQHLASHPWITAAAAAVVTGLIVAAVIISGGDENNSPDKIKNKPALVENDSGKTENKPQKTRDDITETEEKKPSDTHSSQEDIGREQQSADPGEDKDDSRMAAKDKSTKRDNSNSRRSEELEYDQQTREEYAQENTEDQQYFTPDNNPDAIAEAGKSAAQNKRDAKLTVAGGDDKNDFIITGDTCISQPTCFVLPDAPRGYRFSWEHDTENDSLLVKESGDYSAVMIGPEGEIAGRDQITVKYLPVPELNLKARHTVCINKNLKLDPGFYSEEYDFKWSDGVESPVNFVASSKADRKVYTLTVRGCEAYTFKTLVEFDPCDLEIPNVITPNGDGINDRFVIEGLQNYPGSELRIYDRNNNSMYQSNDYNNDFDGEGLEEGVYYFILKVNNNIQTVKKGTLHIVH